MCQPTACARAQRKIGDRLVTKDFGTGTRRFASMTDASAAVCALPGTELAFASEVRYADWTIRPLIRGTPTSKHLTRPRSSGKATKDWRESTAMRWSSPTGRLCCSHAYMKARRQPCSSSRWKCIRQQRRRSESPVRSLPKPETIAIKSLFLHTRSRHPCWRRRMSSTCSSARRLCIHSGCWRRRNTVTTQCALCEPSWSSRSWRLQVGCPPAPPSASISFSCWPPTFRAALMR
jgi:hypothetical protein